MAVIPVQSMADVFEARAKGRDLAKQLGFNSRESSLIAIAISELATNIVKYANEGEIQITLLDKGIEIISKDVGPGIKHPETLLEKRQAMHPFGTGLTSVQRILDEVEITSEEGEGTTIMAKKWKNHQSKEIDQKSFIKTQEIFHYGVLSVPCEGEKYNGDRYFAKENKNQVIIGIIDGLGHGKAASEASGKALRYIKKHLEDPFSSLLKSCHKTIRHTRGVVIGICKIDLKRSKLTFTGVGNVGIKILSTNGEVKRFSAHPGIVGRRFYKVNLRTYSFDDIPTIFLFSDGISSRFNPKEFVNNNVTPQELAENILRKHGKKVDDSTILVVRKL